MSTPTKEFFVIQHFFLSGNSFIVTSACTSTRALTAFFRCSERALHPFALESTFFQSNFSFFSFSPISASLVAARRARLRAAAFCCLAMQKTAHFLVLLRQNSWLKSIRFSQYLSNHFLKFSNENMSDFSFLTNVYIIQIRKCIHSIQFISHMSRRCTLHNNGDDNDMKKSTIAHTCTCIHSYTSKRTPLNSDNFCLPRPKR